MFLIVAQFRGHVLLLISVAALSGAYIGVLRPALLPFLSLASLLSLCLLNFLTLKLNIKRPPFVALTATSLLVFLFSYYLAQERTSRIINSQLPSELESRDLIIAGRVHALISADDEFQRFLFLVARTELEAALNVPGFSGLTRLSWRTDTPVTAGDELRLKVRLKRPRGFVNPRSFDYQLWLLQQGIVATGYVKNIEVEGQAMRQDILDVSLQRAHALRSAVLQKLDKNIASLSHKEFIQALLLGDKSGIDQKQWTLFQQTGTVHLMAISGLHVGMISGLVAMLCGMFFKPLCSYFNPLVKDTIIFLSAVSAAFTYAFMAGFSVPTQRAFLCVLLIGMSILLGRSTSFLQLLALVAVFVAAVNPFILLSPGFVLSFMAVAALILGLSQRAGTISSLITFLKAQVIIMLALAPFMMLLDLPLALSAPIANSLAIPLLSLTILPLLFLGLALLPISDYLSGFVFFTANKFLAGLEACLHFLSLPVIYFSDKPSMLIVLALLAATLCLMPIATLLKKYAYVLILFLFAQHYFHTSSEGTDMTVLDVGQGLAIHIDDGRNSVVYDIGAKFSESFSIANRVLLPFLQKQGVREKFQLILSHADNDHAGAVEHFVPDLEKLSRKPLSIMSGEPGSLPISPVKSCEKGDRLIELNGLESEIIWPAYTEGSASFGTFVEGNNASCVVLIEFDGLSVLLMGDVEKEVEYQLLQSHSLPNAIDVLIAPHHGSGTSSTMALVNHLRPKHVIVSAGYRNRYRHPSEAVLRRYEAINAQIWNTAHHGAISIRLSSSGLSVHGERCMNPKPWHLDEGHCL